MEVKVKQLGLNVINSLTLRTPLFWNRPPQEVMSVPSLEATKQRPHEHPSGTPWKSFQ